MSQVDQVSEALMGKGAPFEVVEEAVQGKSLRVFKNAPETLTDIIERARAHGDAEFIVSGADRLTFAQFFAASDFLATALIEKHGLAKGVSVAICMKNSAEWMISFVAILKAGGVAVLINSRGTTETMCRAIEHTDCILVLADKRRVELIEAGNIDLPILLASDINMSAEPVTPPAIKRRSDDAAAMFFTSGTTGVAKAAVISNRALVTGTMNTQMAMTSVFQKMAAAYDIDVETLKSQLPQSCSLLIFPLFHTSGCSSIFLSTLINGGKLVLMDRWSADEAMRLIEQESVTVFGGVPATHWDILHSENRDKYDLSSLISISNGGQAFPRNLLNAIRETFPKAYIGAGYGMTETAGSVSQAVGEALLSRPRASGIILPMMDVQITDEGGEEVAVGATGEIWAKGATVMTEYYGRPKETAASFSGEWFKTGDVGYVDGDGYIYIVDRKTDMVISGGENIYCVEVEASLNKHPKVLQVCTFGVPDDRLGEKLIACFVPTDETLCADDLESFAKDGLASYCVPKRFVCIDTPFELNVMSKIEKSKVRERYLRGEYGVQA